MNFKKLKRMLSIVLSATMILSSNMTGLAAESWTHKADLKAADADAAVNPRSSQGLTLQGYTLDGVQTDTVPGAADAQTDIMPGTTDTQTPTAPSVAKIGNQPYSSLADAITAAKQLAEGQKNITLTNNAELEGTYNLTGISINTDGHFSNISL